MQSVNETNYPLYPLAFLSALIKKVSELFFSSTDTNQIQENELDFPTNFTMAITSESEDSHSIMDKHNLQSDPDLRPTAIEQNEPDFPENFMAAIESESCSAIEEHDLQSDPDFGPSAIEENDLDFITHITTAIESKVAIIIDNLNESQERMLMKNSAPDEELEHLKIISKYLKQLSHLIDFAKESLKNSTSLSEHEHFNFTFSRHDIAQLCVSFRQRFNHHKSFAGIIKFIEEKIQSFPLNAETLSGNELIKDNKLKLHITKKILSNINEAVSTKIIKKQRHIHQKKHDNNSVLAKVPSETLVTVDEKLALAISHYFAFINNVAIKHFYEGMSQQTTSKQDKEYFSKVISIIKKMHDFENHTGSVNLTQFEEELLAINNGILLLLQRYQPNDTDLILQLEAHCSWCLELIELNLVAEEVDEKRLEIAKLGLDTILDGQHIDHEPKEITQPKPLRNNPALFFLPHIPNKKIAPLQQSLIMTHQTH